MKSTYSLDNLGDNQDFINIIKEKEILTMHSKENTLDDIFIKVTGVNKDE